MTKAELVQRAYEEEFADHVRDLIAALVSEQSEPEERFLAGLKTIREGRDKALALIDQPKESRSPQWPALEKAWIADHPTCAACGTSNNLNVHHVVPVHVDPSKELDKGNLITLCAGNKCHFGRGHGYDWSAWITSVREDAAVQLARVAARRYQ